ncbi:hypothetical protein X745_08250 [Mesorhizobium sp. LNJC374B00]|nr:hypothetical protein X752_11310 [Mesorhizobium sp. LNJC398B00]ESY26405.1 hypothetical protein X751_02785 [Mesorhizobium sp. LNJC395A00]ESY56648.1 hypothetical protein X745_08250 [Mesorhizobium sp. LNJC374B00]
MHIKDKLFTGRCLVNKSGRQAIVVSLTEETKWP